MSQVIGTYHIWRLVGDERDMVDGLSECEEQFAQRYAASLTALTHRYHVAVRVGSTYEQVLSQERAKFLTQEENFVATFNQCSFIGHLGKDPEMSYTPSGKAVTKCSLAVDQGKDQRALWLTIICWEELAERMNQLLFKGAQVFVQGKLAPRSYTDKNGVERQVIEIVASTVQLLEKRKAGTPDDPLEGSEDS